MANLWQRYDSGGILTTCRGHSSSSAEADLPWKTLGKPLLIERCSQAQSGHNLAFGPHRRQSGSFLPCLQSIAPPTLEHSCLKLPKMNPDIHSRRVLSLMKASISPSKHLRAHPTLVRIRNCAPKT